MVPGSCPGLPVGEHLVRPRGHDVGELLTTSKTENADFFWGLRGGGGDFGVVTSFEHQFHPVGMMLGELISYPMDQARELLLEAPGVSGREP